MQCFSFQGVRIKPDATKLPESQNDNASFANIKGTFKRGENSSASNSESDDVDDNIESMQSNAIHLRTKSTSSTYSNGSEAQERPTMLPEVLSKHKNEKLDNDEK